MMKFYALCLFTLLLSLGEVSASERTFQKCLKEGPGALAPSCYSDENRALRREQRNLLSRIRTELTVCEIRWMGYYPDRALKELTLSQQHWERFVKHDCDYETFTFGQGTAVAAEFELCHLNHLKERNKKLSKALEEILFVRNMLEEDKSGGGNDGDGGFIVCPNK